VFARARPLDNGKFKQFRKGLEQLDEEGVVQVLRDPDMGDVENVLAAVGQLQFEVFAYRLGSEFNAPTEIVSAPYQAIRLTDKQSAELVCARSAASASSPAATAPLVRAVREQVPAAAPDERRARAHPRATSSPTPAGSRCQTAHSESPTSATNGPVSSKST
jgi:hypothetical protein